MLVFRSPRGFRPPEYVKDLLITSVRFRIPVWPINACYLGPLTLFLYFRYGRPAPRKRPDERDEAMAMKDHDDQEAERGQGLSRDHSDARLAEGEESRRRRQQSADGNRHGNSDGEEERQDMEGMHDMHDMSGGRPMLATVLIGVSHCGAGCVLGDLVGEWIVYGTGAKINGHPNWAELLIDYGFALLFGILFQYFSIAPMSGQYGPKTIVRAVKADILSLTSFELGLFGWMVIYQVAIWDYNLKITTYTYWWMMQVGFFISLTSFSSRS